jgi:Arc/MetJ-type ribon-helix-helix transcriptional regulator
VAVRLDPDLHRALIERVESADTNASDVIREALRKFLDAA